VTGIRAPGTRRAKSDADRSPEADPDRQPDTNLARHRTHHSAEPNSERNPDAKPQTHVPVQLLFVRLIQTYLLSCRAFAGSLTAFPSAAATA
jgi:hypothetical protein